MFSLRLKELREERMLSQQAFAKKMGLSQSTIGMWESGKREPNFDTVQKIANFFNVPIDYLLGVDTNKTILNKRIAILLTNQYPNDYTPFAESMGVDIFTVFQWIKGVSFTCYDKVVEIANFFNVSVDYLLGRSDEPYNNASSPDITFDDFTYAMHNEAKELTDKDKEMLLNMARMLRERIDDDKKSGGNNGSSE